MDVYTTPVVSDQNRPLFWCPNCNKTTESIKGKCKDCGKDAREIANPKFEASVFPSFSTDPIQILDTDRELILIVPGKGKSLQFHFSLQRHYYPYLAVKARDRNSIVCISVNLSALQADMHSFGRCLPDLNWDRPTERGESFLMKAKSGRVYKFDSLQNTAKHCFVIDGPGVLCNVEPEPYNLLVAIRRYQEWGDEKRFVDQWYKECLQTMDPPEILQFVKAACASDGPTLKLIEGIASGYKIKKKKALTDSDEDFFGGLQPKFDNFGSSSPKRGSSGSESDSDGSWSDS
ncbi:MAG TPA: hypothetical protein VHZ07_22730 [Bryobacteraceae bacterium]|jgi:hypothetical protein|nr:hypothetical protein [Bryobacteraceae bacterium]